MMGKWSDDAKRRIAAVNRADQAAGRKPDPKVTARAREVQAKIRRDDRKAAAKKRRK